MIKATLQALFSKDLIKLRTEIDSYKAEATIWKTEKNIANSAGNLCLHLIGNLNTYIGAVLAKTNYERKRDLEFSLKGISKSELLNKIDETMVVVENGLNQLGEQQLKEDFPVIIWEQATGTEYTLIYLLNHLNYHLGQINYHRRLLDV